MVVSEGRSQPMMSSIRCEARISRTDSEEYKLKLLDVLETIRIIEWSYVNIWGNLDAGAWSNKKFCNLVSLT